MNSRLNFEKKEKKLNFVLSGGTFSFPEFFKRMEISSIIFSQNTSGSTVDFNFEQDSLKGNLSLEKNRLFGAYHFNSFSILFLPKNKFYQSLEGYFSGSGQVQFFDREKEKFSSEALITIEDKDYLNLHGEIVQFLSVMSKYSFPELALLGSFSVKSDAKPIENSRYRFESAF